MKLAEAEQWLKGNRSMANYFRSIEGVEPPHEREAALARADAAMTEQAYWIVRAHNEYLV